MLAAKDELFTRPSGGYTIARSVRTRASASATLSKTFASAGNRKTFTWSSWIKIGQFSTNPYIFASGGASTPEFICSFSSANELNIGYYNGSSYTYRLLTTQVFRDPSAWYHIVIAWDTTQATAANRIKVYVNGSQVTAFSTASYPSQNYDSAYINTTTAQYIGSVGTGAYFDGYLTEINFIDGQALTPSSFGTTNAITGVWQPAKYTGTYGTNGFYLNFSDNSGATATTIGKDYSGNGNNWTPNNISVTAGSTYDSMTDVPTLTSATAANYCVLNPLDKATSFTTADGNLSFTPANTSDLYSCRSTIQIPSTGKWIWQVTNTNSAYMITAGLLSGSTALTAQQTVSCAGMTVGAIGTFFSTTQWMNTTTSWSVTNIGNGDTLVIAYDADAGKIWFGRVASGGTTVTWYNTSGTADPSTGTDPRASGITAGGWFAGFGTYYTPSGASANFGQRPFAFTNTPTGFIALNTYNLPASTITNGAAYMAATLYTGNGSTQNISNTLNGISFQPDLVWYKDRNVARDHSLFDSIRGASQGLSSNLTNAESTYSGVTAFNSNGFSLGSSINGNASTETYVGWQWKAGGTSASNTNGSITSTVSVGATQGFSVVTYSANGSTGTVGHGLGVAPSMIIVKKRNAVERWCVFHTSTSNAYIYLNETFAAETANAQLRFGNNSSVVQPTSTVFTIGSSNDVNGTSGTYVAYCFAAVKGFSAFGSYTGNGSTDGPFVYTGFRPRFILFKRTDSTSDWHMYDSSRDTYNQMQNYLAADISTAEQTVVFGDFVSNGIKIRQSGAGFNASGGTFIYAAFAENPFKNSLAR